ncbi:MAG: hypothetical protein ACXWGV_12935, partial [Solirubrobacterales bacterium]
MASASRSSEQASRADKSVQAFRDALEKSITISLERLQEVLDDAVKRGRITRADAEDLIDKLMDLGKQQTDDALGWMETLLGSGRAASGGSGGGKGRGVVRRPPGADRVLREVDRARRAAGLGSSFP